MMEPVLFQLLLLHYKASVNLQDTDGNTPMHLATIHGHEDVSIESVSKP